MNKNNVYGARVFSQDVSAEMQADVLMVRGGSCAPMATMQLYHNDDRVDNNSKHDYAKNLAVFLCHQIKVPVDRYVIDVHKVSPSP